MDNNWLLFTHLRYPEFQEIFWVEINKRRKKLIESGRSIDFKNEEPKARIFESSETGRENCKITFQEVKDGIRDMGWFRHRFFWSKKVVYWINIMFVIQSKEKCKFGRMRTSSLLEKRKNWWVLSINFVQITWILVPFPCFDTVQSLVWKKNGKIKLIKSMMGYPL